MAQKKRPKKPKLRIAIKHGVWTSWLKFVKPFLGRR